MPCKRPSPSSRLFWPWNVHNVHSSSIGGLSERDFGGDLARSEALGLLARAALGEYPVVFTFRKARTALYFWPRFCWIGTKIPTCCWEWGCTCTASVGTPRGGTDLDLYLRKLGKPGARLAVSATPCKNGITFGKTLREPDSDRPFLQRGFLLDRARLLITPTGLDEVVRALTGCGLVEGKPGIDAARRLLQHLNAELAEEGKRRLVDCVLDTAGRPGRPRPWRDRQAATKQLLGAASTLSPARAPPWSLCPTTSGSAPIKLCACWSGRGAKRRRVPAFVLQPSVRLGRPGAALSRVGLALWDGSPEPFRLHGSWRAVPQRRRKTVLARSFLNCGFWPKPPVHCHYSANTMQGGRDPRLRGFAHAS